MRSIEESPAPALAGEPPPLPCANCGAVLYGAYCARCGQHVADFHRSLWRLVGEFFDNSFCWDNKLLRTLGPLFTQPGQLTQEFMAGRRVRYVLPLRLFLLVAAVCLALLQLDHGDWLQSHLDESHAARTHKHHLRSAGTAATPLASPAETPAPDPSADDDATAQDADTQTASPENAVDRQIDRALQIKEKTYGREGARQEVINGVQRRLEWIALVLLPFFALLLRALYWRRDSFYFAHLIFSLHYHSFLLLFWTAFITWKKLSAATFLLRWMTPFNELLLLLPAVYLFVALRRVYGGGVKRTAAKVLCIGSIHLLALLMGLAAANVLTMLT